MNTNLTYTSFPDPHEDPGVLLVRDTVTVISSVARSTQASNPPCASVTAKNSAEPTAGTVQFELFGVEVKEVPPAFTWKFRFSSSSIADRYSTLKAVKASNCKLDAPTKLFPSNTKLTTEPSGTELTSS